MAKKKPDPLTQIVSELRTHTKQFSLLTADMSEVKAELKTHTAELKIHTAELKIHTTQLKTHTTQFAVLESDVAEIKGDVKELKNVATVRHLEVDHRLRRIEMHLGLPPLPPATAQLR